VASILYQGFDATMWLIAVTLHAGATGQRAVAPVPRTRRVARRDSITGGVALRQGTEVVLEIGAAGLPYGAGPHRCPGTELAEQITAGVVGAIEAAGYRVDRTGVTVDADGRPTTLPIVAGAVAA
jgi:cytochrome P450